MDQWQYLHQARQLQQAPQPGYGQQTFQDNKRTSPRANTGTVDPQLLQASISVAPLSASPKGLTSYSSPSFITPPQVQPASNLRGSDFLYSAPGNFGYHSPYSPNMVTTQNMVSLPFPDTTYMTHFPRNADIHVQAQQHMLQICAQFCPHNAPYFHCFSHFLQNTDS